MQLSQIVNHMHLPKIDLTNNQKKIVIISASVLLIFFLFLVCLFMPASKQMRALKNELISTQQQIKSIEMLLAGAQSRDEAIRLLKEKQRYLCNKFPQKEEESIRLIPEMARKMNINVISVQPGSKTVFLDAAGKQVMIENKVVYYLPIALEASCYFKDLVRYIFELKATLPACVSINSLEINKENQLSGKNRVNVEFNMYLLN
ncbi:MAG: hypothetical protein V1670_00635 [Candidatus Omnitrophota bacterium]